MSLKSFLTVVRRLWARWFRLPRTLRVTANGWKFIGLTVVIGIAAVNTANNLLYLVFGLMLSFIITSGILSELMLRKLSLERVFPAHLFVGQAAPVMVTVTNRKRLMSSFALRLEDATTDVAAPGTAYLLKAPPRASISVTYPVTFTRRGVHQPGRIRLSSRYPFGLFRKSASFVEQTDDLLVYPEITPLSPAAIPQGAASVGDLVSAAKGQGLDLHSIREYAAGDSSGRIHWKSSAKLARLMTKEFHDDQRKRIAVVLDAALPPAPVPAAFFQELEQAVSLAASYVMLLIQEQIQVQLITADSRSAFGDGQRHLFTLLRTLALFQPQAEQRPDNLTAVIRALDRSHTGRIVIGVS